MAEAVAIVGLVASIATLVELSAKIVSRLHNFTSAPSEIPESFRSLSTRLPLLTTTLQNIQSQAEDGRFPDDITKALKVVVDDTSKQVADIQISLSKVLPSDGASKLERALKALKSLAKEDRVQRALEKIYGNNNILVLHQTTQHVNTGDRILEALSKLSVIPPILPCPSSTIPFGRDPDFVDRGDILEQLHRRCALPASRTALVGLGGVGKSQLAIELGYRTREQSPGTWVLWVHAGSTARLEQSFRDITNYVEIPGRQDPKANVFRLVRDWLRGGQSGRWLLILDNVDNPDLLSEAGDADQRGQKTRVDGECWQPITAYLPQSQNGSILVTSRSQAVALKLVEEKDIVAVQPMAPSDALGLLKKKLGPLGQGDDTVDLAAALEFMPLAIVQAAAYISQKAPRCSVEQYLEDFRKSDRKKTSLLNYKGGQLRRDWQAQNSIIITWQISFEHIRGIWPSAADLLSLMSFFDRQGIPEALVRKQAECRNGHGSQEEREEHDGRKEEEEDEDKEHNASECSEDDRFEDDVQILRDYSFLSVGTDRTFEMHALVQLATRKWLEAKGNLEQWKQCFIKNLSAEFPTGEHENWIYCQALFPHVKSAVTQRPKAEGSLREWASLLHNAASYMVGKGSITEAVNLSEIAMKVRKKLHGQEHEETLRSMGMVGSAYELGGRWKEAEEVQVQVMKTSKRVLGEEHPDTLRSIANLAVTYWNQGRWKEAEELQVQVVKIRKRVLGEEHLDILSSIANLAATYWNQGRWEEAEKLEVQVVKIRRRVLGEEHPHTLSSIANLAVTYWDQGRWKEAEELGVQVVKTGRRVRGEEHPDTLISIANLAATYWNQGRWKEAEVLDVQVVKMRKRVLGEEHPDTLSSIADLAATYQNQGRWKEAEELGVQAIKTSRRVLGEEHPNTLRNIANLAVTYWKQGRWKEAEELQVQVINIGKRVLGEEHPDVLNSMYNLAHTFQGQDRAAEAISLMKRCVHLRKQILGLGHPDTEASLKALRGWTDSKNELDQFLNMNFSQE